MKASVESTLRNSTMSQVNWLSSLSLAQPPRIRIFCIISIFSPSIESDMTALNPFDTFRRRQSVAVSWALLAVTAQAQMKEPPCLAVEVEKY